MTFEIENNLKVINSANKQMEEYSFLIELNNKEIETYKQKVKSQSELI